jgi:hypothetical protein
VRTVDDRLRAAAAETREYAAKQWPKSLGQPGSARRPSGWLAFAATFALVVVAFAAIPWLMRLDQPGADPDAPPIATSGTTTLPSTTSTGVEAPQCSATGAAVPEPVDGLPPAVAQTTTAIIAAATDCDLQTLIDLAGSGFTTDFGGGDAETMRTWEEEGQGHLGDLLTVLGMSHAVVDDGAGGEIYVWPSAFAYDNWEEIPQDALDELSALYTQEELEQISLLGAYGGWRVGIDESGDWMFFVAGD